MRKAIVKPYRREFHLSSEQPQQESEMNLGYTSIHVASLRPHLHVRWEGAVSSGNGQERAQGHRHLKAGEMQDVGKGPGETGSMQAIGETLD